ncbi:MAG TPA: hypothetical protein PK971_10535 [Saprospiraceae bacterium]|nr:hypothetical protein [Saprospiraceae bacterium]HND88755.1 hypothetical protein [Saprospiraceae bacterium]
MKKEFLLLDEGPQHDECQGNPKPMCFKKCPNHGWQFEKGEEKGRNIAAKCFRGANLKRVVCFLNKKFLKSSPAIHRRVSHDPPHGRHGRAAENFPFAER